MTGEELLDYTRKDVLRDMAVPCLFSDETVVGFLNEGLQRAAVRTHSFVEDSRELAVVAAENTYALDADVVYVYAVRLDGYPGRLIAATDERLPDDSTLARPLRFALNKESQSIRFYPAPEQDYTALLRVARLPAELTMASLANEIELKAQYQLAIADWAAYRCFSLNDADGVNDAAADRAKFRFNEAVNEVKRDEYRLKIGHNQRVRGNRVK